MDLISIGELVVFAVVLLLMRAQQIALRQRIIRLENTQPGTLFASADSPRSASRIWTHLLVPVIAGVVLAQLLNLAGCNTTPTQSRVSNLELRMTAVEDTLKGLDDRFVPRKDMDRNAGTVQQLQAQRDKRIERLEDGQQQLYTFLMQRGAHGQ